MRQSGDPWHHIRNIRATKDVIQRRINNHLGTQQISQIYIYTVIRRSLTLQKETTAGIRFSQTQNSFPNEYFAVSLRLCLEAKAGVRSSV